MGIAKEILARLNEMAFSRDAWCERVRDKYLSVALGEFTKLYISEELGLPDYWSNEVKRLCQKVTVMMDTTKHKTSFRDRRGALRDAIAEASSDQSQVTSAKNQCINKYDYPYKLVLKMDISSEKMMELMITRFLPQYEINN